MHRAKEKEGHEDTHASSVDERIGQMEMLMRRNNRNRRQSRGDLLDEDTRTSGTDPDSTLIAAEQPSRATAISNLLRGGGSTRDDTSSLTKSSQSPAHHAYNASSLNDSDEENPDPTFGNNRESKSTHNSFPTLPTYVDGRPTIKTYFKIYSPSKGGRMLSVYESAPDLFNFSQSWGWKSSTMVLDDGLCGYECNGEGARGSRDGRLRFMVVIGMI